AQLGQMAGTKEVRDVADRRGRKPRQPRGIDGEHRLPPKRVCANVVTIETAVRCGVIPMGEHFLEAEFGHAVSLGGRAAGVKLRPERPAVAGPTLTLPIAGGPALSLPKGGNREGTREAAGDFDVVSRFN